MSNKMEYDDEVEDEIEEDYGPVPPPPPEVSRRMSVV